ncbi:phosphotransferase [Micromonospora wenchangensis]|uniref:phosphotransferase n=1 Tax=Micromonospora wenchangensis TaxID=1185415 RepID=UPI00341F870B
MSSLAATLDTDGGRIFCKAIQTSNPLARMHHAEARVNPWLPDIAPRLRWKIEESDWLALGFDHVPGRHADLTPGSTDLPVIADTLTALTQGLTPCPPVRVQAATKRWEGRIAPELVDGETLLHTDVTPFNFLVDTRVHVVDWSMPCRGAAWIDTALMIVRLVRAGHSPADSEEWADQIPAWKQAAPDAVDAFAAALADLWEQRRQESPAPHRGPLAVAARSWASYRGASA